MHKILLTGIVAAIVVSAAMLGTGADAMTLSDPAALGVGALTATIVRQATIVCGNTGCVPVQTQRVQHRKHR